MYPTYVTDVPKIKNIENPLEDLKSITLKSDSQRNKTLPKKKTYHHQKVETNLRYKDTIDSESNTTNFPSIGFTSTSERFENNNSNMETPGPGTYNSPSSFKQSFKSFSSKGYLNGFLSIALCAFATVSLLKNSILPCGTSECLPTLQGGSF